VKPPFQARASPQTRLARGKANLARRRPETAPTFNGLHTENAGSIASFYLSGIALPVVRPFGTSKEPVVKQKCFESFKTNVCLSLI